MIRIEPSRLTVRPGDRARMVVTIANLRPIVERFQLELTGACPSEWARITPSEIAVYPDQESTAVVEFTVPRGGVLAGLMPFGLRATSVLDSVTSVVAEGELEIEQIVDLGAKLAPVSSSGRRSATHKVTFTSSGNSPVRLRIGASDPDQRLAFAIQPEILTVPAGAAAVADVTVRAKNLVILGSEARLPFNVVGVPDHPELPSDTSRDAPADEPRRVEGTFVQRPVLTRPVITAASVAMVALIGFVATSGGKGKGDPTLPVPTGLTAESLGPNEIRLAWAAGDGAATYEVSRVGGDHHEVPAVPGSSPAYDWSTDLEPDHEYCFTVMAKGKGGAASEYAKERCQRTRPASTVAAGPPASEAPIASPPGKAKEDPDPVPVPDPKTDSKTDPKTDPKKDPKNDPKEDPKSGATKPETGTTTAAKADPARSCGLPAGNDSDDKAQRGDILTAADPLAGVLRSQQPGGAGCRGFNIGMALAENQTAPGPGKDKYRDSLPADQRDGFNAAVKFSLMRNRAADQAQRGAMVVKANPEVAAAQLAKANGNVFYRLGFNIATGLFGDPKDGATGNTATGPGSDTIRNSLGDAEAVRGYDDAVSFFLGPPARPRS